LTAVLAKSGTAVKQLFLNETHSEYFARQRFGIRNAIVKFYSKYLARKYYRRLELDPHSSSKENYW
jgi:tRNA(Glu) U13 pseudouridine synthase TruD